MYQFPRVKIIMYCKHLLIKNFFKKEQASEANMLLYWEKCNMLREQQRAKIMDGGDSRRCVSIGARSAVCLQLGAVGDGARDVISQWIQMLH